MPEPQPCVNHPKVETRLSCSACGAPICPRCVRQSAVGQKCPACAKVPRSARALGKPSHYLRAGGAGLGAALVGGLLFAQLYGAIRFGTLILAGLLGFGVGRIVSWGAHGQSLAPFPQLAAGCAVIGMAGGLTLLRGTPVTGSPWLLLAYVVAGYFAVRGVQS